MAFRSKPVTVEAVRWFENGDHPRDYENDRPGMKRNRATGALEPVTVSGAVAREKGWEGEVVRRFRHPRIAGTLHCEECGRQIDDHGWIDSGGDGQRVCPGNWVVTTRTGYEVLTPAEFMANYEVAEETETAETA